MYYNIKLCLNDDLFKQKPLIIKAVVKDDALHLITSLWISKMAAMIQSENKGKSQTSSMLIVAMTL